MHLTAERIVDLAMLELPSCPRALVSEALADTVGDMLDRSQVLLTDLTAINIVAATYLYTLQLPATGYDGYRINIPTLVVLDGIEQRAGIDWRMKSASVLQLREIPQAASTGGLQVTVALGLDDIQEADITGLRNWWGALADGTKGKLMLIPGKPWTDQKTGAFYRNEYNSGLSRAMTHAATDGLNEPQRLRM